MHSNIIFSVLYPINSGNIRKMFYLLFALVLLFDGPLGVRAGYPTAQLRKGLNDIRFRMQDLTPANEDLEEFLDKRAALLPYSGGIYGKRAMLPYSGGIYGKRSASGKTSEFALNYPN
ncbi:hypothetical protein ACQ4LE_001958 [Meloidogyne hapla]|uniref:Neuropeptide-Like Protein n=1 Tax=Meloidogyne hapla TaxID=6305 RepID=A0A1I8BS32_MELHA